MLNWLHFGSVVWISYSLLSSLGWLQSVLVVWVDWSTSVIWDSNGLYQWASYSLSYSMNWSSLGWLWPGLVMVWASCSPCQWSRLVKSGLVMVWISQVQVSYSLD